MTGPAPLNRDPQYEVRSAKRWLGKPRYYVVLRAANNEVLSTTETFNSKDAAFNNIDAQIIAVHSLGPVKILDLS
jgi:uncharacterized protein YegP (UPF0339 family)